jgi:hypothetical protein
MVLFPKCIFDTRGLSVIVFWEKGKLSFSHRSLISCFEIDLREANFNSKTKFLSVHTVRILSDFFTIKEALLKLP